MQPHLLLRLEQPAVAALGDEQRDLFGRVDVTVPGRRQPSSRSMSTPLPLRSAIEPRVEPRSDHCIGRMVKSAVSVGFCSATIFGTSSPKMTESTVSRPARAGGESSARSPASRPPAHDQRHERRREDGLALGAEDQARERDADLRRGDVAIELARVFERPAAAGGQRHCRPRPAAASGCAGR